jgi:hypothetical protein
MKNLMSGAIVLFLFSISLLLFQLSCQEDAIAQNNVNQQKNKILYSLKGDYSIKELWVSNYDGSDKIQIPLTNIPTPGVHGFYNSSSISPDGQTVFIGGYLYPSSLSVVYSMSLSGTDVKKIVEYDGLTNSNSYLEEIQAY